MIGPADKAIEAPAAHHSTARARPVSSLNAWLISASEQAPSNAAPAPWTARAAISAPMLGASPQASDATMNTMKSSGEHPPGAEPVAQRASGQDQGGEHQRVDAHHPLQPRGTAGKRGADLPDGHVHHEHIQLDHAEPEAGRRQRPGPLTPAPPPPGGLDEAHHDPLPCARQANPGLQGADIRHGAEVTGLTQPPPRGAYREHNQPPEDDPVHLAEVRDVTRQALGTDKCAGVSPMSDISTLYGAARSSRGRP